VFGRKEEKKERFKEIYSQGNFTQTKIIQDIETGINYLVRVESSGVGITVLLDKDGKPVITSPELYE
jgi:hypothetical protein